jgi:hypothetical protein
LGATLSKILSPGLDPFPFSLIFSSFLVFIGLTRYGTIRSISSCPKFTF